MGLEKYAYIAERGRKRDGVPAPVRPPVSDEEAQALARPLITKKPADVSEDVGFSLLDLHPATRIIRRAMLPAGSDPVDQMQKSASRAFLKSATLGYWDPDPAYKPESGVEKAQDIIGNLAGYALPLAGAGKAVKAAGLAGSLGKKLAGEAVVGAVTGAARKPEEGESRIVNAATDAALFPGMTLAMKGAGSLARKLKNAIAPDFSMAKVGEKLADMMPQRFGQRLREEMVDQLAPLRDFEAPLAKSGAVPKEESAYIAGRQFSGWMGKAENRLSQLSGIIQDVQKTDSTFHNTLGRLSPRVRQQRADFSEYLKLHRMIERSNRGIANPGGETTETAMAKLRAMAAKMGRQVDDSGKIAGMEENAQRIYQYADDLLRESVDAGIISKDGYAAIKAKNERYVPFDVLEYIGDQADNLPRGRKAFSVASQDIVKTMEGTEKEVADPLEALIRKTYKTVNLIERNKVARKFTNLRNAGGEFEQMIVPIEKEGALPKGFGKVSVFEDGYRHDYAAPQPITDALKLMNEHSAGIVAQLGRWQAAPLRAGATSLNVAFMATNLIRDAQTAMLTSKYGFGPITWLRGFSHAIKKDDVFRQFMESGGALSGLYGQTTHVKQSLKEISTSKLGRFVKTVTNPLALVRYVGEAIENAPRIGIMQRALAKGESLMGAGYQARNATVDFSKAGTVMRVANMFIPFLNARMQGNLNVFKGIAHHPLKASLVMSYMVTAPVVAAYYLNTRAFPDLYDDVPQYIKDNFFVIITGSEETENGVEPRMITIPKGDVGRVVGNPIENFLAYLDGKDHKAVDQLGLQIVSNISPIDFEKNGKFDAGMALGGVLPPAAKVASEMATGKSFFTGLPIEPRTIKGVATERIPAEERVTDKTSPMAKMLGKKIGASPIMIDNAIAGMFGGLGRQIADPEKFLTDPGSRFVRTRGGGVKQKQHTILDEVEQKYGGAKFERNTEAEKLFDELKAMKPKEANARFREIAKEDRAMAQRIVDLKKADTLDLDDVERRLASTEVKSGERAEKIYKIVITMKTNRVRNDYVRNLMKKKIVTPQVMGQLRKLIQQGDSA